MRAQVVRSTIARREALQAQVAPLAQVAQRAVAPKRVAIAPMASQIIAGCAGIKGFLFLLVLRVSGYVSDWCLDPGGRSLDP